jgi:hypothetical protein
MIEETRKTQIDFAKALQLQDKKLKVFVKR